MRPRSLPLLKIQRIRLQPSGNFPPIATCMSSSSFSSSASFLGSRARSLLQSASTFVIQATSDNDSSSRAGESSSEHSESWSAWARDWKSKRPLGSERLTIVPGWAVKRRRSAESSIDGVSSGIEPFDIHVTVSGFALLERQIEHASRTQRVIMRMARSLASLPPLPSSDESLFQQLERGDTINAVDSAQAAALLEKPFSFDNMSAESIAAAHSNMNARLHPFWSSALPGRPMRIDIQSITEEDAAHEPLCTFNFDTDFQGHFSKRLVIPWERLCTHPPSVSKVFQGSSDDWILRISAQLLGSEIDAIGSAHGVKRELTTPVTCDGGLRVVCDLDDTVKRTDVLSGLRTVIRNVFCAPLEGVCVSGFDELFRRLAKSGVHFHFVSNSPIELYDVIANFLRLHRFPEHASVRLKNYGQGRALFTSLVEAAGGRKKPSVLEAMDAFPEASFLLIGDSGEEDLELYTEIARERSQQVAGIYIRDVTPTAPDESSLRYQHAETTPELYQPRRQSSSSSVSEDSEVQLAELSSAEQKIMERAAEWCQRQARARLEIPEQIPLRIFSNVDEIILDTTALAESVRSAR